MILVTGGAGFIGSNLVDELVALGYDVAVLDNLSTGKISNLEKVKDKIKFYKEDLRTFDKNILKDVDIVFHLAAQIDVRKSVSDPIYDMDVNIKGSLNLIKNALSMDVKKIIYSSSGGAIYGEPENLPVDEETPAKPVSPYGASKFAVECYLNSFYKIYGLNYTALRYGNVYGIRQDPLGEAGVISIFCGRILSGKRPIIFGDGNQTRDYVNVRDVVKISLSVMKNTKYNVYNVGTGKETSVNELIEILSKIFNKKIIPIYSKERKGEIRRIALDIKRAKEEFNFNPLSLEVGIKEVCEWMIKDKIFWEP